MCIDCAYFCQDSRLLGLALDAERQLLYYTDEYLGIVAEMTISDSHTREIFRNSSTRPRAVVVDSSSR